MFRVAVLDSEILKNPDPQVQDKLWADIFRTCGWKNRQAVAMIPTNFFMQFPPVAKKKLLEGRIPAARKRLAITTPPVIAPNENWVEKALETSWVTDLVTDKDIHLSAKNRVPVEEFFPSWDSGLTTEQPDTVQMSWSAPQLRRALEILCRSTNRIDIIDPYILQPTSIKTLNDILNKLVNSKAIEKSRVDLYIHILINKNEDEFNYTQCGEKFNNLNIKFNTTLIYWKQGPSQLHERCFIADQGMFMVGGSLNSTVGTVMNFTFSNAQNSLRAYYSEKSEYGNQYFIRKSTIM